MQPSDISIVADVVVDAVQKATAPLLERLAQLEAWPPVVGERGPQGEPGVPGARGEKGEPGLHGANGRDADPAPPGLAGEKGDKGDPGERGARGEKGEPGEEGERGLQGSDGLRGEPGPRGERGDTGEKGDPGISGLDGKDGQSIVAASISHVGELLLTMTDGTIKNAGLVIGKAGTNGRDGLPGRTGEDGKDGLDGLGFDDIDIQHDGERSFTFKFVRGDREKTFGAFTIPSLIYRGVYQQGMSYGTGDCVTWGGSLFVAQTGTKAKPETNADWRLAVKRGQDGKK